MIPGAVVYTVLDSLWNSHLRELEGGNKQS